ncbi:23S rRNA (guanosine(2251)-2'-O)-methyltransferase RlmB [Actinobacteria bacterium YIM 96077]|uniref:23S rRNA (Guanosine(2251)-2'-O)-methyltransferase RlmB n=1 Tax=Phytoactinopolyspora halophila TaxID=1981511 RepID=A0A329R3F0_9ACTN|nr:23S rRNA (guanosine(2251)-2'-O)-methyltransferase RlmB [Phytoactinopolyspora halophila]AYY11505.1 23S rRNA (guanosine(2251)-2'-O)-methyltransferase RlmB [Actinobacteria bacterium YIM 96077]RAW18012.1 23S rRNA (guanosine(2251)-2'-O)-methyltransferase RlmB [Phytoactinopolyspora halophila]
MPGNSRRRGAVRKPGTKKGMQVGSGGQRRRGLEGKGPTPRAEDRTGHPAARKAAKKKQQGPKRSGGAGARGRAASAETVAGRNAVVEALRAEVPVKALYVAERIDSDSRVREVLRAASERGLPLLETPRAELDRLTGDAVHQGVALTMPPYEYSHPDELVESAYDAAEAPLIVAVDGVTDPRNLGSVVRSAAAFGAHGVVVPERRSAGMTVGAWKTSAGAAARTPVARATNVARTLRAYHDAGLFVVGLDGAGEIDVADAAVLDQPLCLVVGGEGAGMSRVVTQSCDLVARIPIAREVESLNAGVAAGVALYEIARARR